MAYRADRHFRAYPPCVDPKNPPQRSFSSQRGVVVLSVIGAIVALVAHDRLIPFGTPKFGLFEFGIDASVYRAGGATVLDSTRLYAGALVGELPFTYPPFAALLFAPLGLLADATTHLVFWLGNLALIYLVVRWCWIHLGYRDDRSLRIVSAALAVVFTWLEPIRMTVWLGQINLVLLALVLWDLGRPEGSRLRGLGAGIATGIKMTPGLFLVHLALTRQWRALAIGAATAATSVVLGFVVLFSDAAAFWFGTISDSTRIGDITSGANQSLRGAIPRWFGLDEPSVALWIAVTAVVAVGSLLVAAAAHRRGLTLLGLTVCGLTTPLVSPFSWGHHWVWFLPLTILSLDLALRARRRLVWILPLAVTLPQIAWFHLFPGGVYAIGTFMLPPSSDIEAVLLQTVYPITALVAIVGIGVTLRICDFRHITTRSRTGDESTFSARVSV